MANFTSKTYQMKREILTFSNKFSKKLPKPERKFMADMNYGMLVSNSCLLTDIVDQLHEHSKKINSVDHLSRHLSKGTPKDALDAYLDNIKKWCPAHPVIHIDDSDVVKPDGYKFESLGRVRDGSESTAAKNVYKKRVSCHRSHCTDQQQSSGQSFFRNTFFKGKKLYIHQCYYFFCHGACSCTL